MRCQKRRLKGKTTTARSIPTGIPWRCQRRAQGWTKQPQNTDYNLPYIEIKSLNLLASLVKQSKLLELGNLQLQFPNCIHQKQNRRYYCTVTARNILLWNVFVLYHPKFSINCLLYLSCWNIHSGRTPKPKNILHRYDCSSSNWSKSSLD